MIELGKQVSIAVEIFETLCKGTHSNAYDCCSLKAGEHWRENQSPVDQEDCLYRYAAYQMISEMS
jgi:hypothetical protein